MWDLFILKALETGELRGFSILPLKESLFCPVYCMKVHRCKSQLGSANDRVLGFTFTPVTCLQLQSVGERGAVRLLGIWERMTSWTLPDNFSAKHLVVVRKEE